MRGLLVIVLYIFTCQQILAQDLRDLFVGEYVGTLIETRKGTGKVDTVHKTMSIYLFKSFTSDSLFCKKYSMNAMFAEKYYVHQDTTFSTHQGFTKPFADASDYGELISKNELHQHWYASGGAGVGLVTYDFYGIRSTLAITHEKIPATGDCYPNPTISKVNLHSDYLINSLTVKDLSGRILLSTEEYANDIIIDLSDYPQGIYLIELRSPNQLIIKKVLKE